MIKPTRKKITKPWGYEIILSSDDSPVVSKILHLSKGQRWSLQIHEQKSEVLTLMKGKAILYIDDEQGNLVEIDMEKGKGYLVLAGKRHRCKGIVGADIFESSTPEIGTTKRLEDDYERGDETEEMRKKRTSKGVYTG